MQSYVNEGMIRRNNRIGTFLTVVGIALLIGAVVLALTVQAIFNITLMVSFAGLVISQIGNTQRSRWGKHPRMDEIIDDALKGLDERYSLFHYLLGASHALVTPSGIYALCTTAVEGSISFQKGKWWRERPARRGGAPRRQSLTEPGSQTAGEAQRVDRELRRRLGRDEVPKAEAILVFVHPAAELNADEAPFTSVHAKKLKHHLRSLPKAKTLSSSDVAAVVEALGLSSA
ncbi:MAG: hypothetical protein A2Z66_00970 [Chloroflexi bacterium RBG_13_66_10]|nr:MAG: hypothetical protein A2Z66_00970 [Chloroflexi bacterium RBG_13_66_10]